MELFDTYLRSPPTLRDTTRAVYLFLTCRFLSNRVLGLTAEPQFSIALSLIKNKELDVCYVLTRPYVLLMFQCFYYYCYDYLTEHFLKFWRDQTLLWLPKAETHAQSRPWRLCSFSPRANRSFSFFSSLRNFVLKSFLGRHDLASVLGPHVIVEGANHTHPYMQRTGNTASCCDLVLALCNHLSLLRTQWP